MGARSNKFTSLATAIKQRQGDTTQAEETNAETGEAGATDGAGGSVRAAGQDTAASSLEPRVTSPGKKNRPAKEKRRRGRPANGKRSNSDYQQITLYVPRLLYQSVQTKLKKRRELRKFSGPRDMSDLVSMLVKRWDEQSQEA